MENYSDPPLLEETDKELSKSSWTSTIFVVEPRMLIRECLTQCLRQAGLTQQVLSASRVIDWSDIAEIGSVPVVVLLSFPEVMKARAEINEERLVFAQAGVIPPVIVLADEEDPAQIVEVLESGAKGFIPTNMPFRVTIEAIRLVIAGGTYVPASSLLASRMNVEKFESGNSLFGHSFFTERQLAVIEMLREGKANKMIAHALNMRESTVKVHIRNIMRKLSASNRTQVAYLYQSMISEITPSEKLASSS